MQHLILLIIFLLIAGLVFTVTKWKGGMHMTFSQHAATNRNSQRYYASLFLITLPLLLLFFAAWFVPTKQLPDAFIWFAVLSSIFQIACTLIPEVGKNKTLHRVLAGISAVTLLPMVTIIATSPYLSEVVKGIALGSFVSMLIILFLALTNLKRNKYALLLQAGYYALFFIVILTTTYL